MKNPKNTVIAQFVGKTITEVEIYRFNLFNHPLPKWITKHLSIKIRYPTDDSSNIMMMTLKEKDTLVVTHNFDGALK